jgi:GntR family transcriptional regulator/MocR family aminotransferase
LCVGSFSKVHSPPLRLVFLVVPPSLRDALAKAKFLTAWHSGTRGRLRLPSSLKKAVSPATSARCAANTKPAPPGRRNPAAGFGQCPDADRVLGWIAPERAERVRYAAARACCPGWRVVPARRFAVGNAATSGLVFGYGAIPTTRIEHSLQRLREGMDEGSPGA